MASCTQCGSYTKFEGGLCYDCYKKSKAPSNTVVAEIDIEEGLSEKEHEYRYNMIKGRIAETLIQELFLSMHYNVFRYGMENTIPGIIELLKGVHSDVTNTIRSMPDFVIQNPNVSTADVYFIEVKFRASGNFAFKDIRKNYPWVNAYFIVVSKKHIKCISYKELKEGKEITATCHNYLGNRKEFELNKEKIIEFCDFAIMFFKNV